MYVCLHARMSLVWGCQQRPEEGGHLLKLELQVVVTHSRWLLGTKDPPEAFFFINYFLFYVYECLPACMYDRHMCV